MLIDTDKAKSRAFSLIEAIVAMGIVGVAFVSLYSGLTYGFSRVQLSRENHRATQILIEKTETIRLYNWSQITDNKYIPDKFEVTYYPNQKGEASGVLYKGTLKIEDVGTGTNYESNMKKVTVKLTWKSGKLEREREILTYVSEFGLHNRAL